MNIIVILMGNSFVSGGRGSRAAAHPVRSGSGRKLRVEPRRVGRGHRPAHRPDSRGSPESAQPVFRSGRHSLPLSHQDQPQEQVREE